MRLFDSVGARPGAAPTRDSARTSPPARPWIRTRSSRSTRTGRSPSSGPSGSGKPPWVSHYGLKRELVGIALLLFAVFLAGALGALALAQLRVGVDVRGNVGWVGLLARAARSSRSSAGPPRADSARAGGARAAHCSAGSSRDGPVVDDLLRGRRRARCRSPSALAVSGAAGRAERRPPACGATFVAYYWRAWFGGVRRVGVVALAISALTAATLRWNPIRACSSARARADTVASRRAGGDEPLRAAEASPQEGDGRRPRAGARAAAGGDAGARSVAALQATRRPTPIAEGGRGDRGASTESAAEEEVERRRAAERDERDRRRDRGHRARRRRAATSCRRPTCSARRRRATPSRASASSTRWA